MGKCFRPNLIRYSFILFIFSLVGCSHFGSGKYIEIEAGDSYETLAQKYNLNALRLKQINNSKKLVIGDHIFIPNQEGILGQIQKNGTPTSPSENPMAPGAVSSYGYDLDLMWPLPAHERVSSKFGPRRGKLHMGVDIPAPIGTHILSVASGRVSFAGWIKGYGKTVVVAHGNGIFSVYAHASKLLVRRGEEVDQGSALAKVGRTGRSSGPHLHFEIRHRERPLDPLAFYPNSKSQEVVLREK